MTVQEWLGEENKLGIDIWEKKYQYENETFDEWLDRVSGGNNDIRELIVQKKFLFGGRILANRGLDKLGKKITLSNCYVLTPPEDNIESIFETASKLGRTYSYGGGVGIDISKLAPRGAIVNNTAKTTSGSVSFTDLFDLVTGLIGQNGRRGALMLSISCDHPDLEEFIELKSDLDKTTNANISIRITDEFMKAVKEKRKHTLSFTRKETCEVITKEVDAYDIFRKICEMNWNYAEPGMLFWDRIENWNLLSEDPDFHYAGTNPCAEEPLPAGGSCLLGSINLSEFVDDDNAFDFDDFKKTVHKAVVALNEVLDEGLSLHPLQEQRDSVRDWRQIGLGIFGLADCLIKLGVRYGSDKAVHYCNRIGFTMASEAIRASSELAYKFGSYPRYEWDKIECSNYLFDNTSSPIIDSVAFNGLRNSQLLTIAPTGTLSTMLGVSGGIEPIYANSYTRKTQSLHGHDEYYKVYTPIVKKYMEEHGLKDEKDLPDFFVTAGELDYKERINMQAIWQDHIDASISSTVNVPNEFTVEDTMDLYLYAWEKGLKGVTIFRDGCARVGVLTNSEPEKKEEVVETKETESGKIKFNSLKPITRNELGSRLPGTTYVKDTACGKLYITVNRDKDDNLVEVFIDAGKSGGCAANAECLGRYASAAMRCGMSIDSIVDITKGVKCSACIQVKGSKSKKIDGVSCGDIVARVIKEEYEHYHGNKKEEKTETIDISEKPKCPECGCELVYEGGCNTCKNCGYSKCD